MPMRQILRLEPLEDRTLLSGNVMANFNSANGVLTIAGDAGNNYITITESAVSPSGSYDIHVAGKLLTGPPPDNTKVNGQQSVDFTVNNLTSINISMQGGNDTVVMDGSANPINMAGNLTMSFAAGKGKDTFTTTGVNANTITVKAVGSGTDNVTMNNTNAGSVAVTLGTGTDNVYMNNSGNSAATPEKIGVLKIDTSASTGGGNVYISNFTNVGTGSRAVPGIGNLTVTSTGGGTNTIDVTNASFISGKLYTGSGTSNVYVSGTGFVSGTGAALTTMLVNTLGGGTVTYDNSTASSANITVGQGPATVDTSNDNITGAGGLTVKAGVAGNTAVDNYTAYNDKVTGPMNVQILDNAPQYWAPTATPPYYIIYPSLESNFTMSNDSVGGKLTIVTGNSFKTVTVGGDDAPVTAGSLSANIGGSPSPILNAQTVSFNTLVSGAETIVVGDFTSPQPPLPLPLLSSFSLSGSAASLALMVGANAGGGVSQNANVTGSEIVVVGNNASTVNVQRSQGGSSGTPNIIKVGNNAGEVTVTGNADAGDSDLMENITVGSNSGPVTIGGNLVVSGVGSWAQKITLGDNDTLNANTNVTGSETITSTTGNSDNVVVNGATVSGALMINLPGNFDTVIVDPSESVPNAVGSLTIITGNNATISVSNTNSGGNVNITAGSSAAISMSSVSATGNVSVGAGIGAYINLGAVTVTGNMSVGAGDSANIYLEGVTSDNGSVNVSAGNNAGYISLDNVNAYQGGVNVTALDNTYELAVTNSTASTMNIQDGDANDTGNPFILLDGDNVGTGGAVYNSSVANSLSVILGNGNNTLQLGGSTAEDFLNVLGGLSVSSGTGINTFFAGNVLTDFGTVNGGGGASSTFTDYGGNLGLVITGFVGYP